MIAFASAVEPLRMANRLSEHQIYSWVTFSADGAPVAASNGLVLSPDLSINEAGNLDLIFICGGVNIENSYDKALLFWIRKLAQQNTPIGAICTGSYLMAQAGLLNGYRATIHWENLASLREQYPETIVTSELFEIDRQSLYLHRWYRPAGHDAFTDHATAGCGACCRDFRGIRL